MTCSELRTFDWFTNVIPASLSRTRSLCDLSAKSFAYQSGDSVSISFVQCNLLTVVCAPTCCLRSSYLATRRRLKAFRSTSVWGGRRVCTLMANRELRTVGRIGPCGVHQGQRAAVTRLLTALNIPKGILGKYSGLKVCFAHFATLLRGILV